MITAAAVAVKVAVAFFVVSTVAVIVTVYVPAAVGVQTTLLPLLTHPEPDDGLADTVKSVPCVVTVNVRDVPTATLDVVGDIPIVTVAWFTVNDNENALLPPLVVDTVNVPL